MVQAQGCVYVACLEKKDDPWRYRVRSFLEKMRMNESHWAHYELSFVKRGRFIYCKRGGERRWAQVGEEGCVYLESGVERGLIAHYFYYLTEVGDKSLVEHGCGKFEEIGKGIKWKSFY